MAESFSVATKTPGWLGSGNIRRTFPLRLRQHNRFGTSPLPSRPSQLSLHCRRPISPRPTRLLTLHVLICPERNRQWRLGASETGLLTPRGGTKKAHHHSICVMPHSFGPT